jgi:hypothetical protein
MVKERFPGLFADYMDMETRTLIREQRRAIAEGNYNKKPSMFLVGKPGLAKAVERWRTKNPAIRLEEVMWGESYSNAF